MALTSIAKDSRTATDGQVQFKFYAGGVQGDEQTVLRKMRIRQLHGAAFIGQGLSLVYPDSFSLALPGLFRDDAEFDYVLKELQPTMTAQCRNRGYEILALLQLGVAYAYSTKRIGDIETLRRSKPWLIPGDIMAETYFQVLKISPVSAGVADVLTGLQSGLIHTVISPPTGMIALQWHSRVKYRLDTKLSHAIGVFMVDKRQWDRLPVATMGQVREIVDRHVGELTKMVREQNAEAQAIMNRSGIETIAPNAETLRQLDSANKEVAGLLVGKSFSADVLNRLQQLLKVYRENADKR